MRSLQAIVTVVLAVAAAGCTSDETGVRGTWEVVEVNGESIELDVNVLETPKLVLVDGRIDGPMGGCRDFAGTYENDESTVMVQPGDMTEELCTIGDGSDEPVISEGALMQLFDADEFSYEVSNGIMSWSSGSTEVVLRRS